MEGKSGEKKSSKGFFSRIFDKLDKKMEEKAKSSSCCCKSDDKEGKKSCCS
ncbi:MAG: hypothetical protein NTZ63_03710 [Candidatus Omnitrophica bacterium]|nr:hypothetical protein [Candidatus Omnitrophota bacterium]